MLSPNGLREQAATFAKMGANYNNSRHRITDCSTSDSHTPLSQTRNSTSAAQSTRRPQASPYAAWNTVALPEIEYGKEDEEDEESTDGEDDAARHEDTKNCSDSVYTPSSMQRVHGNPYAALTSSRIDSMENFGGGSYYGQAAPTSSHGQTSQPQNYKPGPQQRGSLYARTQQSPSYSFQPSTITQQSPRSYGIGESHDTEKSGRKRVDTLPPQIQAQLKSLERRYIQTDASTNNAESIDARTKRFRNPILVSISLHFLGYRRVAVPYHAQFFTTGRVSQQAFVVSICVSNRVLGLQNALDGTRRTGQSWQNP